MEEKEKKKKKEYVRSMFDELDQAKYDSHRIWDKS